MEIPLLILGEKYLWSCSFLLWLAFEAIICFAVLKSDQINFKF